VGGAPSGTLSALLPLAMPTSEQWVLRLTGMISIHNEPIGVRLCRIPASHSVVLFQASRFGV
jgi:hypothetical protein